MSSIKEPQELKVVQYTQRNGRVGEQKKKRGVHTVEEY